MKKIVLLFLVATLPLIIHIKTIEYPLEVLARFQTAPVQADLFSWWKNCVLYACSAALAISGWSRGGADRKALAVFSLSVILSTLLTPFPEVAWYGMPNYLEGGLAALSYVVLYLSASDAQLSSQELVPALSFCTTLMFLAAASQYISPSFFQSAARWLVFGPHSEYELSIETWPLFGTLINSNVLGTFAALAYPIFLVRRRWVMTALSVMLAVGSQSRGGWVAMGLATAYVALRSRSWRALLPVGFVALGVLLVMIHPTHEGMKWQLGSSGRVYVWKKTVGMLSPRFMLYGDGYGAFALEFHQNDPEGKRAQGWTPDTIVDRPHNFYLQTLHATGGISMLSLLVIFVCFVASCKDLALTASVLAYLVNVAFTDSCTAVAPLFWIILGTGAGQIRTRRKL